jgi:predicted PurR-regulated permease PerM
MAKVEHFPKDGVSKYFFIGLFVVVVALTFWVAKPFLNALIVSAVVAYVFRPLYLWLNKKIKYKNVCSLLVSAFILFLFIMPLFLVIESAAPDARYAYVRAKQKIMSGEFIDVRCASSNENFLCVWQSKISDFLQQPDIKYQMSDAVSKVTGFVIEKISSVVLALPMILLNLFVIFFSVFYLLRDGDLLVESAKSILPIHPKHRDHIFKRLQQTARAVIYGALVVAVIQGTLGGLGFLIFGISSPLLWGIVMALFALVPFVGTALIWVPAAVGLILAGSAENNPVLLWKGIGLMIYGALIIAGIDNVLKPMLISDQAKIHPVLILVGVLGGLAAFGISGFIVGPLIVAVFKVFIEIYKQEYEEA